MINSFKCKEPVEKGVYGVSCVHIVHNHPWCIYNQDGKSCNDDIE